MIDRPGLTDVIPGRDKRLSRRWSPVVDSYALTAAAPRADYLSARPAGVGMDSAFCRWADTLNRLASTSFGSVAVAAHVHQRFSDVRRVASTFCP